MVFFGSSDAYWCFLPSISAPSQSLSASSSPSLALSSSLSSASAPTLNPQATKARPGRVQGKVRSEGSTGLSGASGVFKGFSGVYDNSLLGYYLLTMLNIMCRLPGLQRKTKHLQACFFARGTSFARFGICDHSLPSAGICCCKVSPPLRDTWRHLQS